MALHQFHTAQNDQAAADHATRAGHTDDQPYHYDFSAGGYGFPQPPKFDDKLQEREYLKGRLAAAFRIFGQRGFDEGVAGHITVRVRNSPVQNQITANLSQGSRGGAHHVGEPLWPLLQPDASIRSPPHRL